MVSMTGARLRRLMPRWLAGRAESADPRGERETTSRGAGREVEARLDRARFHLGRGRRARERGKFEEGAREAGRALAHNPGDSWAYALLSRCLLRQSHPDLAGARRAAERACALSPTNGYFVRLLLDVLDAQGDRAGREDALAWAWWSGAAVERWLARDGHPARPAQRCRGPVVERGAADPRQPSGEVTSRGTMGRASLPAQGVPV